MNTASLIAVTQPEQDLSVEEFIVYCARVSNPANQSNHATAPKLMRYLTTHGHWSPFEMVSITMEIKTKTGYVRATQEQFFRSWNGGHIAVVRSFDDAYNVLTMEGL